jgi:FkbM family methyltransferase
MDNNEFYSQYGQDKYLDQDVFKGKTNGFFIEIGANDGVRFSNTYFLEKNRNWKGICVEPHPSAFEKLKKNRQAKLINACIADSKIDNEFLKIEGYAEMLSGLVDKYDPAHIQRIENDLKNHGGSKDIIKIPSMTLDSIIKDNLLTEIDYCSIDTEGGEMDILETANLNENNIAVISVENNYYKKSLKRYMKKWGYSLIGKRGDDEFFKKKKSSFWFFDWS